MQNQLHQLKEEALLAIKAAKDKVDLEELENKFLGRKNGELTNLMKGLKDLEVEARKIAGQLANDVKNMIEAALNEKKGELSSGEWAMELEKERVDVTAPALPAVERGHLHPITQVLEEMNGVARAMGFIVEDGPDLDSDYYCFEALNIPTTHPARDSQDTFYIKNHPQWCMRPHVSNMQVRLMQKYGAPLRIAYPGRVFRNEATDASHEHTFYQYESLVVDKDMNIGHLIGIIKELLRGLYQTDVEVRLRPGFFPFVEPGFEMDMKCLICGGKGCGACKHSGWVETLGCGLIHPRVVEIAGFDPKVWHGLAFGMGLTRLAMQKYGIHDIRLLMGGDLRFLKQF
ncbi:MAG: phenylalanine--tRNA ligase subunit alpha [Candidatus Magasanikbacteria bacterium]